MLETGTYNDEIPYSEKMKQLWHPYFSPRKFAFSRVLRWRLGTNNGY